MEAWDERKKMNVLITQQENKGECYNWRMLRDDNGKETI